jgi:hypothetical protein
VTSKSATVFVFVVFVVGATVLHIDITGSLSSIKSAIDLSSTGIFYLLVQLLWAALRSWAAVVGLVFL